MFTRSIALCVAGTLAASLTTWAAVEPLKVIRIEIHQIEDGPAVGDRVNFVPGETLFLSFDVANYAITKEQRVAVSWVIEAVDPKGIPIVPPATGKKEATLTAEDKNWMPKARQSIVVPSPAPGGSYSIHIKVTDENSKDTAVADTKFSVKGPELPPVTKLVIRNFGFFHAEEDPRPMTSPVYRPGDSVFARFQIAGYKYGPRNAIETTYGISILGPAGNVMFTQDPASEEKSAAFYPKPYVDGMMSIPVNQGTKAGDYTLVVTAHDKVGEQTSEVRETFHIE